MKQSWGLILLILFIFPTTIDLYPAENTKTYHNDNPGFSIDYPVELEENFYLAVEVYVSDGPGGDCSVRLEDDVVVTNDGYQIFSLFPFEEEVLDGTPVGQLIP